MMKQQNSMLDFANRLKQGNYKYEMDMLIRRKEAKAEAKRLAALLRSKIPEITQLWGFGSVFERDRPFSISSDIDIALEGGEGDYFTAFEIVNSSSFKVDLIDITDKNDRFASLIRKHGINLLIEN